MYVLELLKKKKKKKMGMSSQMQMEKIQYEGEKRRSGTETVPTITKAVSFFYRI